MTATPSDLREAERIVGDAARAYERGRGMLLDVLSTAVAEALAAQRETLRNAHYEDLVKVRDIIDSALSYQAAVSKADDFIDDRIAELTDGPTEKNL